MEAPSWPADAKTCKFAATYMDHVVTRFHIADFTKKANRARLDILDDVRCRVKLLLTVQRVVWAPLPP